MSERFDRLSQISHQLRTPLTVIMATVNNLLDGAFGKLNAEQEKWLRKLSGHTTTLEQLITEIIGSMKDGNLQPAAPSHPSKTPPVAPTLEHLFDWKRSPRILIVDDETDILETVSEALSMKGLESHACTNGADAREAARRLHPDLILMDVHLGGDNGLDICRAIKAELPSYTPVLLVTGQEDLAKKMNLEKFDPDDFLIKPFQIAELLSRVQSMLRTKKLYEELEKTKDKAA